MPLWSTAHDHRGSAVRQGSASSSNEPPPVASRGVPDAEAHVQQLRTRFANGRIRHALTQIATDAGNKLRERVVPLVGELLVDNAEAGPALRGVAAWLVHLGLENGREADAALERLAPGLATDRRPRRALDRIPTK